MKLKSVPPGRGVAWLRGGFSVFAKRPFVFAALFAEFLFFGVVAAQVPLVGTVVLLAALPLVSLGFMLATHRALQGRFPGFGVFIVPLKRSRRHTVVLLKLGVVYAAATLAVMYLSDVIDGGTFDALQDAMAGSRSGGEASKEQIGELLSNPRLEIGMLVRFGLAALLSVPFWHAPALVHWAGQGVGQALFSSTLACWRNKGAFTVYALAWVGVIFGFGIVANVLAALLQQPQLIALIAVPAGLLFSTVFYVSLYFTFADCFARGTPQTPAEALPGGDRAGET